MYKISVTTIEKFRRYMKNASALDTEQNLLESIMGLFTGNDKTRFGTAFGKIIEDGDKLKAKHMGVDGYLFDNIFFPDQLAEPGLQFRNAHPSMIYEVSLSKVYDLGEFSVYVSGRADGIEGIEGRDTKTKFRSPDFQEYIDSYQWRYYLDMLNLKTFYYDIFEVKGFDSLNPSGVTFLTDISIIPYEPLYCSSYSGMEEDCKILLSDFFKYIEQRDLFKYLKTITLTK